MADRVHLHVRQDVGNHQRMNHVGLAGIAALPLVALAGEAESLFEGREIVLGPVFADLCFQLGKQLLDGIRRAMEQTVQPRTRRTLGATVLRL